MNFSVRARVFAIAMLAAVAICGTASGTASASNNKIVYLHGRTMNGWPAAGALTAGPAWDHVMLSYDGNARMSDATVRSIVKNALQANCTTASGNQCVILCYSAGCARMLYAINELAGAGTPVDNAAWITATASAAGGTEVAEAATRWGIHFISKLMGDSADIDFDLTRSAMRGTYAFIQNSAPVNMWHLAGGYKNICRRIFFFVKICGNGQFPGTVSDARGDGAVPLHSSCGFATDGFYTDCNPWQNWTINTPSRYTNRVAQQDAVYWADHREMLGLGVQAASTRLAQTSTYSTPEFLPEVTSDGVANVTMDDGDGHLDTGTTNNTARIYDALGVSSASPSVIAGDTCTTTNNGTCTNYSPPPMCTAGGDVCSQDSDCCSNRCDPSYFRCYT